MKLGPHNICEECGLPMSVCNALNYYRRGLKEDGDREYRRFLDTQLEAFRELVETSLK